MIFLKFWLDYGYENLQENTWDLFLALLIKIFIWLYIASQKNGCYRTHNDFFFQFSDFASLASIPRGI
jgi:hypothetical protein